MGSCLNKDPEKSANDEISQHMGFAEHEAKNTFKLLLLGAGSAGKTTLLKQWKYCFIQNKGYPEEEYESSIDEIYYNVVKLLGTLAWNCVKLKIEIKNKEIIEIMDTILSLCGEEDGYMEFYGRNQFGIENFDEKLLKLFDSKCIQDTYKSRHKYTIQDNHSYFLNKNKLNEILKNQKYIPSFNDLLQSRRMTTGITYERFQYKYKMINDSSDNIIKRKEFKYPYEYLICDVGGQRSERKKWLELFDNVSGIIYVIAISGYNQNLFEDKNINRLHEAFELYYKTINNPIFENTTFIILLNKYDLFIKKLNNKIGFNQFNSTKYNNYKGDIYDSNEIISWIKYKLNYLNKTNKILCLHVTDATNTQDIEQLFNQIHDTIIRNNLKNIGLI